MKMNTTYRTWKHTSFSFYHFIFTYFFLFLRLMLIHFGSFFLKFIGIFGDLKNELTVVHLFLFNWMRCMHPYIKLSLFWIFHSIQKFGVNLNQFRIVIKIFIFSSPRTTNICKFFAFQSPLSVRMEGTIVDLLVKLNLLTCWLNWIGFYLKMGHLDRVVHARPFRPCFACSACHVPPPFRTFLHRCAQSELSWEYFWFRSEIWKINFSKKLDIEVLDQNGNQGSKRLDSNSEKNSLI